MRACVGVSEGVCVHLFEELQLDGVLQELSHGAGAMADEGFLAERYGLSLQENRGRGAWETVSSICNAPYGVRKKPFVMYMFS